MLVVRGNYRFVERVFLVATLIYATYILSAILARPPWGEVLRAVVTPTLHGWDGKFVAMTIGVIGTTIAPWMQFYQQAAVVDKGLTAEEYRLTRLDTYLGMITTNVVAFFIIVACGATLFVHGIEIRDAKDAAVALAPLAGRYASLLFAVGLLNAAIFSVAIIPLSTAYAVCEAFGWEAGLNRTVRDAPAFFGIFAVMLGAAGLVVLIPELPLVRVMLLSQILNGILLPFVLIFLILLTNDTRLMGAYRNSWVFNAIASVTVIVMVVLTAALIRLGL